MRRYRLLPVLIIALAALAGCATTQELEAKHPWLPAYRECLESMKQAPGYAVEQGAGVATLLTGFPGNSGWHQRYLVLCMGDHGWRWGFDRAPARRMTDAEAAQWPELRAKLAEAFEANERARAESIRKP